MSIAVRRSAHLPIAQARRGRSLRRLLAALLLGPLLAAPSAARPLASDLPGEFGGYIATEMRVFAHAPQFPEQEARALVAGVVAEPEWYYDWERGTHAVVFVPFVRADSHDGRRSHFDIRELNYLYVGDGWELRAGIGKVFWGVAESAHLVDIINQNDTVEDVDGEDKLGQPMLQLTVPSSVGAFSAFVLPGFRERTFPGRRGRLRPALEIAHRDVTYQSGAEQHHVDFAARWRHSLAAWDIGLSHFYGTGRAPRFQVRVTGDDLLTPEDVGSRLRLAPIYDLIHQTGIDVQYTGENILWKLEAFGREGQGSYRIAAVAGFEYSFFGIFGSDADVGVLGEFLYDSFRAPDLPALADLPAGGIPPAALTDDPRLRLSAPPSPFEHDVFVGTRLALNDVQSTTLLAGAIVDVEDGSRFWTAEASRRLGDRFRVSLDVRVFEGFRRASFFHSIVKDDFVQLQVARFF